MTNKILNQLKWDNNPYKEIEYSTNTHKIELYIEFTPGDEFKLMVTNLKTGRIGVSDNTQKWGELDALFGRKTWQEWLEKQNELLTEYVKKELEEEEEEE